MRSLPGPIRELPDRDRIGLARRAHQRRRNIELTGWTEAPRGGEGLTCEASKRLVVAIDAVGVMGIAAQRQVSVLCRQSPYIDIHVEERAAVPLEQRPILGGVLLEKEDHLRLHLPCDGQCRFAGGKIVGNLRGPDWMRLGHREIRIVMRLEPFHRYLDQRW